MDIIPVVTKTQLESYDSDRLFKWLNEELQENSQPTLDPSVQTLMNGKCSWVLLLYICSVKDRFNTCIQCVYVVHTNRWFHFCGCRLASSLYVLYFFTVVQ